MLGVSDLAMGPSWDSKGFFRRGGVLDGWLIHSSARKGGWWKHQSLGSLLLRLPRHSLFTCLGSYLLLSGHCQRVHGDPQSLPSALSASPRSPSLPSAQFRECTQRMSADESKATPPPRPGFLSPPLTASVPSHPSHPSCLHLGRWWRSPAQVCASLPHWTVHLQFHPASLTVLSPRATVTWLAARPMHSPLTCFLLEASSTWLHSALRSLVCSHQPSAFSLIFLRPWRCRNPHGFFVSSVNSSRHFNSSLALLPDIIFTLNGENRERGRLKCLLWHLIILPEAVTLIRKRKVILPASGVGQWCNGGKFTSSESPGVRHRAASSAQHHSILLFWFPAHTPGLISYLPHPDNIKSLLIAFMPWPLPAPTPPKPLAPSPFYHCLIYLK